MFKRDHHQNILTVLNALKADFFVEVGAYFGGGTCIALQYNEYRISKDIDFLCAVGPGYRKLRSEIARHGYSALFADFSDIELPRDIKADQYGVRFAVIVKNVPIKFEIVAEGRIQFGSPALYGWCPLPCLSFEDSCSEKLLANADRWNDVSVESRDLIDLAVLRLQSAIPQSAYDKAETAYPVIEPLAKAIGWFQRDTKYRDRCFSALQVNDRIKIVDGIDLLAFDHGLAPTDRVSEEKPLIKF